jgi:hypothetical protein
VFHSKVPAREIANRGESFNATDVEVDLSQPSRRFVLAGTAPGIWLIVYEHGGRGYHHHLMVFTKQEDHWRLVAGVSGFLNGSTFGSLVRAIKANKFSDQPGYPEF